MLGVSGGIAAYKAVEICRRLVDAGAFVSPVLTDAAQRFVGATTFSALASEPVRTSLFDEVDVSPHTRLGQSADLILVAPATAHLLSAYATGASTDLLTATLLATRAPVMVCPAMHTEMWEHAAVQENVATLVRRGVTLVGPDDGHLAGGDSGPGRLSDPAAIVDAVRSLLSGAPVEAPDGQSDLVGLTVLVTAGGTREPVDPVRYLGNRSSGKQGHAIATEAVGRGARVVLITTSDREAPVTVRRIQVETAAEMHRAVAEAAPGCDVIIMAAAVADFRPVDVAATKLKKADGVPMVRLEPTVDILAELGAQRRPDQTLVGFAAETDDVAAHAAAKLERKGVDLIVANDVSAPHVGFGHDTNAVRILRASGEHTSVPLSGKRQVAAAVLDAVLAFRGATPAGGAHSLSTTSEQPTLPRSST